MLPHYRRLNDIKMATTNSTYAADLETDSLVSINIPLPQTPHVNERGLTLPAAIFVSHPQSPETQASSQLLVHQIPTFNLTAAAGHDVDTTQDIHHTSITGLGFHDNHDLLQPSRMEEERPSSVLSILRRPLSSISRTVRSVLPSGRDLFPNSRVKGLVHMFADRLRRQQSKVDNEESDVSDDSSLVSERASSVQSSVVKKKLDSLAGSDSDDEQLSISERRRRKSVRGRVMKKLRLSNSFKPTCKYFIDPHGGVFLFWMGVVCLAIVYNALAIPFRASFDVYQTKGLTIWLVLDYLCDAVYLADIFLVQCHLSYRVNGVLEPMLKRIGLKYIKSWKFWFDALSLFPLDILYVVPLLRFNSLLRLPRLLKVGSVKVFQDRFESWSPYPHAYRMMKLFCYFLYIIHIYTCVYYAVSRLEGLGTNEWVYNGNGTDYLRCFYWATITVITSHDKEERNPSTNVEYVVEMFGYLFGLFVLAIIIGEISNIVEAANINRLDAYRKWDRLKEYIHLWNIPKELQNRIQSWNDNVLLTQQNVLDENKVIDTLPVKMKTDLAIHVHLDTLCKVALFQDCEKTLLRELVLKLRPVLFVPGDYICRKGEIGKEMYIVNHGQVQVVSGTGENEVLAELGPGAVFGEISLLAVGGGNRRTAHVRSKGFAKLFVLNKKDLHDTLVDYPDAQETLKRKAKYVLKKDRQRERRQSMAQQQPQQDMESLMARARLANKVPNHGPARAAVTALTTAARAARARAAASKLKEEKKRHCSNGSKLVTQVEVHSDHTPQAHAAALNRREDCKGMAFEMLPNNKIISESLSHGSCQQQQNATKSINSSRITYSTLWPPARDAVIATNTSHTMLPSMESEETAEIGFLFDDSLIG